MAQQLYERLWYAERDRRVELGVNLRPLNRPGSPVYSRAENAAPFLGVICAVWAALLLGGLLWAVAIAASGIILMLTAVNVMVMMRLRRRATEMALSGIDGWQRLWDAGGLSLRLPDRHRTQCESPADDWRRFVHDHLPAVEPEGMEA